MIGPNGAGKTTLFNVLTGFIPPSVGSIELRVRRSAAFLPDKIARLGIARTFQNIRLFSRMTVLENVMTAQQLRVGEGLGEALLSLPSFLGRSASSVRPHWSTWVAWGLRSMRTQWPPRCHTAFSGNWRLPARSPLSPRFCCSMSRQPA